MVYFDNFYNQLTINRKSKHVYIHSAIFKTKLKLVFIANEFQIDSDRYDRCAIRKMDIFTEHEMLFLLINLWFYFISVSNWIRTYFVILGFHQEFQGFLFFVIFWQLHSTNDKKVYQRIKGNDILFSRKLFFFQGKFRNYKTCQKHTTIFVMHKYKLDGIDSSAL